MFLRKLGLFLILSSHPLFAENVGVLIDLHGMATFDLSSKRLEVFDAVRALGDTFAVNPLDVFAASKLPHKSMRCERYDTDHRSLKNWGAMLVQPIDIKPDSAMTPTCQDGPTCIQYCVCDQTYETRSLVQLGYSYGWGINEYETVFDEHPPKHWLIVTVPGSTGSGFVTRPLRAQYISGPRSVVIHTLILGSDSTPSFSESWSQNTGGRVFRATSHSDIASKVFQAMAHMNQWTEVLPEQRLAASPPQWVKAVALQANEQLMATLIADTDRPLLPPVIFRGILPSSANTSTFIRGLATNYAHFGVPATVLSVIDDVEGDAAIHLHKKIPTPDAPQRVTRSYNNRYFDTTLLSDEPLTRSKACALQRGFVLKKL